MSGTSFRRKLRELQSILPSDPKEHGGKETYWWDSRGVYAQPADKILRISYGPILPTATGVDQDGILYTEITWRTPQKAWASRWMLDQDARTPAVLMALPGSPVDAMRQRDASRWIAYAINRITTEPVKLATRLGWIGERFVWPGAMEGYTWPLDPLDPPGDLQETAAGVRALASLPDGAGNLAMVVLGLAAAAPLIRWSRNRNPIIGLAHKTSTGKSTLTRFALSLWGRHEDATVSATATARSIEDKGCMRPDTPMLVEDLQVRYQRDPQSVASTFYFLGNGQRRHLANQKQGATLTGAIGGQMRYGTAFFAAEHEVTAGLQGGVQLRTWEIEDPPIPAGDLVTVRAVERATSRGAGACGRLLAEIYSRRGAAWGDILDQEGETIAGHPLDTTSLSAGDVKAVRALAWGLEALRDTLDVREINPHEVVAWLTGRLKARREAMVDAVATAWEQLISAVLGGAWGKEIVGSMGDLEKHHDDILAVNGEIVAWRDGFQTSRASVSDWKQDEAWEHLGINTTSQFARRLIAPYGRSEASLVKEWAARGWVERTSLGRLKWNRRGHGRVEVRISAAQLAHWTKWDHDQGTPGPGHPDFEGATP